jgi:hypothetical protein
MNPSIEDSIVETYQGQWRLGCRVICEAVTEVPEDALKSWQHDGKVYCLRPLSKHDCASTIRGSLKHSLVHQAGTAAAVWNIGGVFVKVKAWRPEMQLETDTIQFVNKVSPFPTPSTVYSWVNTKWSRSCLILKSVRGRTLNQAWNSMSSDCRTQLANTLARFCKTLAMSTSEKLETANGNGIVEPFLTARAPQSLGSHSSCARILSHSFSPIFWTLSPPTP